MKKRSLSIAGHRTSLALEPEFWDGLEQMAAEQELSLPALIVQIDSTRTSENLSSSLRLAVLAFFKDQAASNCS